MNEKEIIFINKLKLMSMSESKSILKKMTAEELDNSIICMIGMLKNQELKEKEAVMVNASLNFLDQAEFYRLMLDYRYIPYHDKVAAEIAYEKIIEYIKSKIFK